MLRTISSINDALERQKIFNGLEPGEIAYSEVGEEMDAINRGDGESSSSELSSWHGRDSFVREASASRRPLERRSW